MREEEAVGGDGAVGEGGHEPVDVPGRAAYVFRVTFRLEPAAGVHVAPERFETTLERRADPPGTDGWLFFRDNCWRGEANDEAHLCELASEALGVDVVSVAFRELRTDEAYLSALREAIAENLSQFNADDVDEVLHKYLGSSIHVRG
ncbi:LWR-salt protein [Haloglomus litoreum]|uniref:LWR-salt protein n=1 Tax=Haloglomus litoreum TaxID=3034026 RepID=UPI0023E809CA|nr:LWR-salt protein [Haloglomus sp. DT116]